MMPSSLNGDRALAALEEAPPTMNTRTKLMRDLQKPARFTPSTFSAEAACMFPKYALKVLPKVYSIAAT